MKINNSLDNPRWKALKCKCDKSSIEKSYPITECLHCKFQEREDSLPKKNFQFKEKKWTKEGKLISEEMKTISQITIVRGKNFQEIIGWTF